MCLLEFGTSCPKCSDDIPWTWATVEAWPYRRAKSSKTCGLNAIPCLHGAKLMAFLDMGDGDQELNKLRQRRRMCQFIEKYCTDDTPSFVGHITLCELAWVLERLYKQDLTEIAQVI